MTVNDRFALTCRNIAHIAGAYLLRAYKGCCSGVLAFAGKAFFTSVTKNGYGKNKQYLFHVEKFRQLNYK